MIIHYAISFILLAVTGLSAFHAPKWWVKIWDAGRFQTALAMSLLLVVGIFTFDFTEGIPILVTVLLTGGISYYSYRIYPFTPFHKTELIATKKRTNPIRLLASNVRMSNEEYAKLLSLIDKQQPTIVVLTEINQKWTAALAVLKGNYPHHIIHPQEDGYGIALFSKIPLENSELKFLVEAHIPSIHTQIILKGKRIQLIGMHPCPPTPWTVEEHKDIEMIKVAGLTNTNLLPTIVAGDLNDVGWSAVTNTFRTVSGLKDPRIGRGFYNTYNANIPFFRYPIDHFFVSPHFKLLKLACLENIGSDHYPVLIELNLEA